MNRSDHRYITANGKTMKLFEWSKETGIGPNTICARLRYGWSESDAVSIPVSSSNKYRKITG